MQFKNVPLPFIILILLASALSGHTSSFVSARVSHCGNSLGEEFECLGVGANQREPEGHLHSCEHKTHEYGTVPRT